jgi:hypothetical protein
MFCDQFIHRVSYLHENYCGVHVVDQPELDPAVDPRIAVGCQPGCEQIDVPR